MEKTDLESKLEELKDFLKYKLEKLKDFHYSGFGSHWPGEARYSWMAGQREAYQKCQDILYDRCSGLKKEAKKPDEELKE